MIPWYIHTKQIENEFFCDSLRVKVKLNRLVHFIFYSTPYFFCKTSVCLYHKTTTRRYRACSTAVLPRGFRWNVLPNRRSVARGEGGLGPETVSRMKNILLHFLKIICVENLIRWRIDGGGGDNADGQIDTDFIPPVSSSFRFSVP